MQFKKLTSYLTAFGLAMTIIYTTFNMPVDNTLNVSSTQTVISDSTSTGQYDTGMMSQSTIDAIWMGAEVLISSLYTILKLAVVLALPQLFFAEWYGGTSFYPLIAPWVAAWQVMSGLALTWLIIQIKIKMGGKVMD